MDLEKQVAELKIELETERAKVAKVEVLKVEAETKVTKLETKIAELEATDKVKDELVTKLKTDLAEVTEQKSKLETEVVTLQAAKLEADRVSSLVSAGLDKNEAVEFVKLFANIGDEQFNKIVAIKLEAKAEKPAESTSTEKPAPTPKPELKVEPESTAPLAFTATNQTQDTINSCVAYLKSRTVLKK